VYNGLHQLEIIMDYEAKEQALDQLAEIVRRKFERDRTQRMIMFYGIIFMIIAAFAAPIWSWIWLGAGFVDWVVSKVFRPIRVVVTQKRNLQGERHGG
jgi:hypothetical protein